MKILRLNMTFSVQKFLMELSAKQFKQMVGKFFFLLKDPVPNDSSRLQGYPYYRVDIGEYRIIYDFDPEELRIILIGKRNDGNVYRQLSRFYK